MSCIGDILSGCGAFLGGVALGLCMALTVGMSISSCIMVSMVRGRALRRRSEGSFVSSSGHSRSCCRIFHIVVA